MTWVYNDFVLHAELTPPPAAAAVQKSLGMDQLKAHLPPALGGTSLQPVTPAGTSALAPPPAELAAVAPGPAIAATAPVAAAPPVEPAQPTSPAKPDAPLQAPALKTEPVEEEAPHGTKRAASELADDGDTEDGDGSGTAGDAAKAARTDDSSPDNDAAPAEGARHAAKPAADAEAEAR